MASKFDLSGTMVWPTMLFTRHWSEHAVHAPQVIAYLRTLQSEQQERIASQTAIGSKSATGLYESDFDLFQREQPDLQKLYRFIKQNIAIAASIANQHERTPQQLNVSIVDSWYHITNGGGFHDAHVHHGCSWCGIYYLQAGESGARHGQSAPNGASRFYCPYNLGGGYRDYGNKYLASTIDAPIEDGMLLLFPSYLLHSGLPYSGSVDRIVIAFNAQVFANE